MYNQNTRINAAIAYCFLGPIFLLARRNTPLAEPFVRSHAKRSTLIFLLMIASLFLVFFLKSLLLISVFQILLYDIIFTAVLIIFFWILLFSAYRAYQWVEARNLLSIDTSVNFENTDGYSENQKAEIIMAFVPILSIFIASRSSQNEVHIAARLSNFFLFFAVVFGVIFGTYVNMLSFLWLLAYISLAVSHAVFLLVKNTFFTLPLYQFIPTYHDIEASVFASFSMIKEYLFAAFGKEKQKNFQNEFSLARKKFSEIHTFEEKFWVHPMIIALPIINFITIPAFFQEKYHEYQGNISEWFFLSIFAILLFFFANTFWLYFLVFPIFTLWAYATKNANIRAPFTSIARGIFIFLYKTKNKISALKQSEQVESVTFEKNP